MGKTGPFALTGATVVTGDRDGTALPGTSVIVDACGVIEAVGPTDAVPVPRSTRCELISAGRCAGVRRWL